MNKKLFLLKLLIILVFIYPLTKMLLIIPYMFITFSEIEMSNNNTLFIALVTTFLLSFIVLKFVIDFFPIILKVSFKSIDSIFRKPKLEEICNFHKIKYLKEKRWFI